MHRATKINAFSVRPFLGTSLIQVFEILRDLRYATKMALFIDHMLQKSCFLGANICSSLSHVWDLLITLIRRNSPSFNSRHPHEMGSEIGYSCNKVQDIIC
jgi:hypothetical protein